jgi:hypothetical protein
MRNGKYHVDGNTKKGSVGIDQMVKLAKGMPQ